MRRFRAPSRRALLDAAAAVSHLPVMERIFHPKSRRPLYACCAGVSIMLTASAAATHAKMVCEVISAPHFIVDAAAYFFHGVGSVPLIRYFEYWWNVLAGVVEEA